MSQPERDPQVRSPQTDAHTDVPPHPHPMLKRLERLVGTWRVFDPSGADATSGQIEYTWLPGGYYLLHHVDLKESHGLEVIGYDAASDSLKAHYFEGNTGQLLEYTYDVAEDLVTISFDKMDGQQVSGQFVGTFSDNDTWSGRWDWVENDGTNGYDVTYSRLK